MRYGFTDEGEKTLENREKYDVRTLQREDNSEELSEKSALQSENIQKFLAANLQNNSDSEKQYTVVEEKTEQHIVDDNVPLIDIAEVGLSYDPRETKVSVKPVESQPCVPIVNIFAKPVSDVDTFYANLDKQAKDYRQQQENEAEDSLFGRYT